MYPDCIKELVGITDKTTECLAGSGISNVSTLDLFVTQDPAYDACKLKGGDTECDLIKIIDEMREEAYRQVTVDVNAVLAKRIKTRPDYQAFIGQNSFGADYASHLVPAQPSIDILTEYRPGAFIRIDKIALMIYPIGGALTVPLRLYRVYSETDLELLHTFEVQIIRRSQTPIPVISYSIPCDGGVYRLMYDYDSTKMVVPDSNYECGCGDQLKSARGFRLANSSKTYGISLWATFSCGTDGALCSLLSDHVYKTMIGFMIRKLTIYMVLNKIYQRNDVNRFTLLSSEEMVAQMESYMLWYNSRLTWLEDQRDHPIDGFCLTCEGGMGGRKMNLLTGR